MHVQMLEIMALQKNCVTGNLHIAAVLKQRSMFPSKCFKSSQVSAMWCIYTVGFVLFVYLEYLKGIFTREIASVYT